eukprot:scaffold143526_cov17-Tisochrysis_lutea.AAC.1
MGQLLQFACAASVKCHRNAQPRATPEGRTYVPAVSARRMFSCHEPVFLLLESLSLTPCPRLTLPKRCRG